jgi:hypothetical protein
MPLTVTLPEVLDAARRSHSAAIHTALPGKVVRYYELDQTADIQPVINIATIDPETDELDSETPPVLPKIPVAFPRGKGFHLSFPLEEGDHVWVICCESAIGNWRLTGTQSDPGDLRRHHLSHAFAVPGAFPIPDLLLDHADPLNEGKMIIGKDGPLEFSKIKISDALIQLGGPDLATLPVALATPLIAYLTQVMAAITAVNSLALTMVPTSATAAAATASSTAIAAAATPNPLIAATMVKAK